MTLEQLQDAHRIVIFGYGKEGNVTWDIVKNLGPDVTVTDEQDIEHSHYKKPEVVFPELTPDDVVVRAPGIPLHNAFLKQAKARGARITTATNLFLSEVKGKALTIGITGTKGKSTTASLLTHVLNQCGKKARLVGNIGEPMLKHLNDTADTIFVMELSSHQLEDLAIGPDIGVILNLFPEHMEHHGSVEDYYLAKSKMLLADHVFVHPSLEARFPNASLFQDSTQLHDHLRLPGEHNRQNARAVLTITRFLGLDDAVVLHAMESFKSLPHRLESVAVVDDIEFVNDSISTTPESTIAAMEVFGDRLGYLVLGGQDRGYDFSALADALSARSSVRVYLMPGAERLAHALEQVGVPYLPVQDFSDVMTDVFEHKNYQTVCLLSPASPSYNQFKNFEDRGEQFRKAVFASTP